MRTWAAIALTGLILAGPSSTNALQFSFEFSSIPGEGQIAGMDINDADDVVGNLDYFGTGSPTRTGFVRRAGEFSVIDFPGSDIYNGTRAGGINDAGRVVGRFTEQATGATHGFVLEDGVLRQFDVPNAWHTDASDINNNGVIVGRTFLDSGPEIGTAFMRAGDEYTLFRPEGVRGSFGIQFVGVNDLRNTVGSVLDDEGFRAFAVLNGIYMPFSIPGAWSTAALGINNANQIVGFFDDSDGTHGFLMDATGIYQVDVPRDISDETILAGINERGVLVGAVGFDRFPLQEILVASPCDAISDTCRLAPRIGDPLIDFVPEPSTVILLSSGLMVLATRRDVRPSRRQ